MPIVAAYTWSEKRDTIKVLVPLKGVSASKADVQVSASTLKVNFAPYILDLVLFKDIDSLKHKATVKDGVLNITLCKKEVGVWGALVKEMSKVETEIVKKEASAQQSALHEDLDAQRHERKLAEEKNSLRKQMKLEEMERTRVENMKLEEKTSAEKEVYDVFAKMQLNNNVAQTTSRADGKSAATANKKRVSFGNGNSAATIDSFLEADDIDEVHPSPVSFKAKKSTESGALSDIDEDYPEEPTPESSQHDIFDRNAQEMNYTDVEEEEEVRYVPPPRSTGLSANADQKIGISFTPRVFPTPMRESKAAEEEDWVAKNRRHIKKHGVLGKHNADVSEEDPVWLKAKGDDFFRSGDMRSALNAYSAALETDPRMLPCLANRSVCLLRCGQPAECRADCSAAMQIIADEAEANAAGGANSDIPASHAALSAVQVKNAVMVVKLMMRRGAAACQMGLFTEALTDFLQANVKYQKLSGQQASSLAGVSVESLAGDVSRLRLLVDAEALKKEGDALFAERNTTDALLKYNAALALIPVHVSCLSNRAACRMAQQDLPGCIADCSTAIALLQSDSEGKFSTDSTSVKKELRFDSTNNVLQQDQVKTMLFTILPPAGSTKRSAWILKTLLRRGVALAQLNQFDAAVEDYQRAVALDPTNEAVKSDLMQMMAARDRATAEGAVSVQ